MAVYKEMLGVVEVLDDPEFADWILRQSEELLQAPAEVLWGLYLRWKREED